MVNKMFENIGLKLFSLIFAIIIWFAITNVINPMVEDSMMVDVNLRNEEALTKINKTYVLSGQKSCKITYKILANRQKNVRQSDFDLYVDLENLTPETTSLPIQYTFSSEIASYLNDIKIEPQNLQIKLSDVSRKQFDVKYNILGNPGENRTIGNVILSPNIIYISGTDEEIEKIDKVYIDININKKDEMIYGVEHIKIKDKSGANINVENIDLGVSEISYTVSVLSRATVSVNSNVVGNVKNGYEYVGTTINPTSVIIEGPKAIVENMFSINLPEMNIDNLTESKEYVFAASDVLPNGIRCNTSVITVKINVNDNIINRPVRDLENEGPIKDIRNATEQDNNDVKPTEEIVDSKKRIE